MASYIGDDVRSCLEIERCRPVVREGGCAESQGIRIGEGRRVLGGRWRAGWRTWRRVISIEGGGRGLAN